MRLIVDAQLPPILAGWLRANGHDAVAVREIGMRDADDQAIRVRAAAERAVVVTKDHDFARLVSSGSTSLAVVWARCGNLPMRALISRFETAWLAIEATLIEGGKLVELR